MVVEKLVFGRLNSNHFLYQEQRQQRQRLLPQVHSGFKDRFTQGWNNTEMI